MMIRHKPFTLNTIFYGLLLWAAIGSLLAFLQGAHIDGAAWFWGAWLPIILMWSMIFTAPLALIAFLLWPRG